MAVFVGVVVVSSPAAPAPPVRSPAGSVSPAVVRKVAEIHGCVAFRILIFLLTNKCTVR